MNLIGIALQSIAFRSQSIVYEGLICGEIQILVLHTPIQTIVRCRKNLVPDKVRIPSYIVVIASLVTILQMVIKAYAPEVDKSLGLFIPLIVVNCIILGRAEAYAAKNGPVESIFDGIGIGIGFSLALTLLGAVREFLGAGAIFGVTLQGENYGMLLFVLAPGAFLALGYLIAIVNQLRSKK